MAALRIWWSPRRVITLAAASMTSERDTGLGFDVGVWVMRAPSIHFSSNGCANCRTLNLRGLRGPRSARMVQLRCNCPCEVQRDVAAQRCGEPPKSNNRIAPPGIAAAALRVPSRLGQSVTAMIDEGL